jgi:hypothetical protein
MRQGGLMLWMVVADTATSLTKHCLRSAEYKPPSMRPHMQVPITAHVVSVDYNTFEAIRAVDGKEERAKLVIGGSTFAKCTWLDGTSWESKVPNLMLTVIRAPLRTKTRKRPAAALKRPAAKKSGVGDLSDDLEEQEGSEGGDEEEEEEEEEEDAIVEDGKPKKKAKADDQEEL